MIGMDHLFDASPRADRSGRIYGVVVGVVTNIEDEDHLGRVKVRFPWLSDADESNWARIATPMAGAQRGMFFLPEVDDEVLVVFEQGLVSRPFVIGALWNATDKPPVTSDADNNVRSITSRSGNVIEFSDNEGEGAKITIADKARGNTIVIDAKKSTVTITSAGDLAIKAEGNISIETSSGDLVMKAKNITVEGSGNTAIKATQQASMEASSGIAITCSAGVSVNNDALKVIG